VNLEKIPTPEKLYILSVSLTQYLGGYLRKKDFRDFSLVEKSVTSERQSSEETLMRELESKSLSHFPFFFIYIPVINIFFLSAVKGKYATHWKNGFGLSILTVIAFGIFGLSSLIPYLVVFPISFGLGYKERFGYQMPVAYDISHFLGKIWFKMTHLHKKAKELRAKDEKITIKIEEKKSPEETPKENSPEEKPSTLETK